MWGRSGEDRFNLALLDGIKDAHFGLAWELSVRGKSVRCRGVLTEELTEGFELFPPHPPFSSLRGLTIFPTPSG
jgi:hypothetical protein